MKCYYLEKLKLLYIIRSYRFDEKKPGLLWYSILIIHISKKKIDEGENSATWRF